MGKREARVTGAANRIQVDGKTYEVSPLSLKQLTELQMEALNSYKRRYLQTYRENLDLLPANQTQALIEAKLDEVARWDLDDLPKKPVYLTDAIPVTKALCDRILANYPLEIDEKETGRTDSQYLRILASMLDRKEIKPEEVEVLAGVRPSKRMTSYDAWWVNGCFEGMQALAYESLKHNPDITKEVIANWPMSVLSEASRLAEEVTAPDLGNT